MAGQTGKETALVNSAREGDLKAFTRLVEMYQRRLFGFVRGKKALSLDMQMNLFDAAKWRNPFGAELLVEIGKIEGGKDFIREIDARLMVSNLTWILTYSRDLDTWVIRHMEKRDPEFAEVLKAGYLVFEDIILLDPDAVQAILAKVSKAAVFTAMLTCPGKVNEYLSSILFGGR